MLKKLCVTGAVLAASAGFVLLGGSAPAAADDLIDVDAPIVVCGVNAEIISDFGTAECYGGASTGF